MTSAASKPLRAAEQLAGQQEEAEQPGHEHEGLDVVHTFPLDGVKKKSETPSAPLSRGRRSRSNAGDLLPSDPG